MHTSVESNESVKLHPFNNAILYSIVHLSNITLKYNWFSILLFCFAVIDYTGSDRARHFEPCSKRVRLVYKECLKK